MPRAIKNAAYTHIFGLRTASTLDLDDAPAALQTVKIFGDSDSSATSVAASAAHQNSGFCTIALTAAEFKYDYCGLYLDDTATNTQIDWIRTEPAIDSGVAQAGASQTITLRAAASLANDQVVGNVIELVSGTGAGQSRVCVANANSTDLVTVDRAWNTNTSSDTVYIIHPYMAPISNGGFIKSSVSDATPTTTEFTGATGLSSTNDFYNNCTIVFISGTLQGIMCRVTDYVGASRTFTLSPQPSPLASAPADGDHFLIVGRVF